MPQRRSGAGKIQACAGSSPVTRGDQRRDAPNCPSLHENPYLASVMIPRPSVSPSSETIAHRLWTPRRIGYPNKRLCCSYLTNRGERKWGTAAGCPPFFSCVPRMLANTQKLLSARTAMMLATDEGSARGAPVFASTKTQSVSPRTSSFASDLRTNL